MKSLSAPLMAFVGLGLIIFSERIGPANPRMAAGVFGGAVIVFSLITWMIVTLRRDPPA
jgi:hypothetical protein